MLMAIVFTSTACNAKINNSITETHKVFGNCEMCKKTIEKAVKQNKIASGIWNKDTKILTLTFDSTKTNADEVLKRIAHAGYDNEKYLASNDAYNNLDDCCQYERKIINKTPVITASLPNEIKSEKMEDMPMAAETKDSIKAIELPIETSTTPKVEIAKTKTDFTALLTKYYAIKNALIADNSILASKSSSGLVAEINAIKMENMSASEHIVWMKYYDKLKTDATQISNAKNIEKQRTAFSSLSNNLWSTVKGLKIKDNGAIYVDYCPMKDAYWLSKETAIKNPYYGKSMLTCGSIKETIK